MPQYSIEQQKALALARARKRKAAAQTVSVDGPSSLPGPFGRMQRAAETEQGRRNQSAYDAVGALSGEQADPLDFGGRSAGRTITDEFGQAFKDHTMRSLTQDMERSAFSEGFRARARELLPADKAAMIDMPTLTPQREDVVDAWMQRQAQEQALYSDVQVNVPGDDASIILDYGLRRRRAYDAAKQAGFQKPDAAVGRLEAGVQGLQRGATLTLDDEIIGLGEGIRALGNPNETFGEGFRRGERMRNARAAEGFRDRPVTSVITEGVGAAPSYMAGGGLISGGAKQAAARTGLANVIPQGSSNFARGTRYTGRLAGLTGGGAMAAGTHEAIFGEARQGRDATIGDRVQNFTDAATDPVNAAALPALSLMRRGTRGIMTGGARVTPDDVAARMGNEFGVPATQSQSTAAIQEAGKEVLEGNLQGGSIKSFRFIENMLRDSGFSRDRIATGFERISDTLRGSPDSRLDLARLMEKEFAPDNPQVAQNIRTFLLKVGMDSQEGRATVVAATDALRKTQADDLRETAGYELGTQPRLEAAQQAKANMEGVGGLYEEALQRAPRDGEMVDLARQTLSQSPEAQTALGPRARAMGLSVDQYIDQNPLQALHWTQSLIRQNDDRFSKAIADNMADILDRSVPGYQGLRRQYGEQATLRDLVGRVEGGKLQKGFGDSLTQMAGRELTADDLIARYEGLTPDQRQAADLSIRDAFTDPLRKTKGAGVDEFGRDTAGARMTQLQQEGVIDTMDRMLGERGQRLTGRVREFIDERQYAADIDPRTGSNTVNKANAQGDGAVPFSNGLGRTIGNADGSVAPSLLADSALALTGNAPVVTLARNGGMGNAFSKILQPRRKSQIELARMLLKRAPTDGLRNAFSPQGGIPPARPFNDGRIVESGPQPMPPGDPMRPVSGRIQGGVDERGFPLSQVATEVAEQVTPRYSAPKQPQTLLSFVRSQGGIQDPGGDMASMLGGNNRIPGVISEVRRSGPESVSSKQPDYMLQAAIEEGYLPAGASIDDLVMAIANDAAAVGDDAARVYPIEGYQADDVTEYLAYLSEQRRAPKPRNAFGSDKPKPSGRNAFSTDQ